MTMQCPSCQHTFVRKAWHCDACGLTAPFAEVENLHHLQFVIDWLTKRGPQLEDSQSFARLSAMATTEYNAARAHVLPPPAPKPAPPVVNPTEVAAQPSVGSQSAVALQAAVAPQAQIATQPALKPVVAPPQPKPQAPPPPAFNGKDIWDAAVKFVVSGMLLRGLLYLGAFMVVAAAVVIAVVYWRLFPLPLQIGLVSAVPLAFYAAGFGLRRAVNMPQAGSVLIGIGALLVAVDFIAIYQIAQLAGRIDFNLYWLLASAACTVIYTATAAYLPAEFLLYTTLLAGHSTALALARVLGLDESGQMLAVTLTTSLSAVLAFPMLPTRWQEVSTAARRLAYVLLPIWCVSALPVFGLATWARLGIFGLSTLVLGAFSWHLRKPMLARLAVVVSFGIGLTLLFAPELESLNDIVLALVVLMQLYFGAALALHYLPFFKNLGEPYAAVLTAWRSFTYWAANGLALFLAGLAWFTTAWVSVVVYGFVTLQFVIGWAHTRKIYYAWTLPFFFWVTTFLGFDALNFASEVQLALGLGVANVFLVAAMLVGQQKDQRAWLAQLRLPLELSTLLAGAALFMIAVMLAGFTLGCEQTFGCSGLPQFAWLLLAQVGGVVLTGVFAATRRTRWPLYLTPWLATLPLLAYFYFYTPTWFQWQFAIEHSGVVLMALGLVVGLVALALDHTAKRYGHGLFVGAYGLLGLGMLVSPVATPYSFGALSGLLVVLALSHRYAVSGRFASLEDALTLASKVDSGLAMFGRTVFLAWFAFSSISWPIWFINVVLQRILPQADYGLALCAIAGAYLLAGLVTKRHAAAPSTFPSWVWFSLALGLSTVGALIILEHPNAHYAVIAALTALGLGAGWVAVAVLRRRPVALYPALALVHLALLNYLGSLPAGEPRYAVYPFHALTWALVLASLALMRFVLPKAQHWTQHLLQLNWATPLLHFVLFDVLVWQVIALGGADTTFILAVGHGALFALLVQAWQERALTFVSLGFRALAAYSFIVWLKLDALQSTWLLLAQSIGFYLATRLIQRWTTLQLWRPAAQIAVGTASAVVVFLTLSRVSLISTTHAAGIFSVLMVLYGAISVINHNPYAVYVLLASAYGAVGFATQNLYAMPQTVQVLPFIGLGWVLGGATLALAKLDEAKSFPAVLIVPTWARPFAQVLVFHLIFGLALSVFLQTETALVFAASHSVLLAVMAQRWQSQPLAYGAIGLSVWAGLNYGGWQQWEVNLIALAFAGLALALYSLACGLRWRAAQFARLQFWATPLRHVAWGLFALTSMVGLGLIFSAPQEAAYLFTVLGAMVLLAAYVNRKLELGYVGVGLWLLSWWLVLHYTGTTEMQWYSVPTGLYAIAVGFLERRYQTAGQRNWGLLAETFGWVVLLLTTWIQSFDEQAGFVYFALLLAEGLLAIWWGAARRVKAPFFIGLAGVSLNVVAQFALLFSDSSTLTRWLIIGGFGVLIIAVAVVVERQRTLLLERAQWLKHELETWS